MFTALDCMLSASSSCGFMPAHLVASSDDDITLIPMRLLLPIPVTTLPSLLLPLTLGPQPCFSHCLLQLLHRRAPHSQLLALPLTTWPSSFCHDLSIDMLFETSMACSVMLFCNGKWRCGGGRGWHRVLISMQHAKRCCLYACFWHVAGLHGHADLQSMQGMW